jgi:hypothetical protein
VAERSTFGGQDQKIHNGGNGAPAPGRRLLKRPTTAEMERIARERPSATLSVPVIVDSIRRVAGCSRATAHRAIRDALTAGVRGRTEEPTSVDCTGRRLTLFLR